MTKLQTFTFAVALLGQTNLSECQSSGPIVKTADGAVQGHPAFNSAPVGNISKWEDIYVWKGIPFAASTAGQNRFRPPQPAESWTGTLKADTFGAVCPQDSRLEPGIVYGEDCLNLNVWASNATKSAAPVMLWSYPAGSYGSQSLFNGAGMASKGVVFVTYNYRFGSLGFLASPDLSEEMSEAYGTKSSGNWGVLDQMAALSWVRKNIAAFGGDPERITVLGQSAGSAATYHIVNSPLIKGLINGAIIQSGVRDPHDPQAKTLAEGYLNQTAAYKIGAAYMASLNATSIADMRALPFQSLIPRFRGPYNFAPVLDHYALPATYDEILRKGAANDVPIMTGNTEDESGAEFGKAISPSAYKSNLVQQFGTRWATRLLAAYPGNDTQQASSSSHQLFSDISKVGTWNWVQRWAESSSSDVYTYQWDHAPPGQNRGAYHESEINYVLNNLYDTPNTPWQPEDFAIAEKMSAYWANFAKTGNPNKGGSYSGGPLPHFPRTTAGKTVFRTGNGFNSIPIATSARQALIEEFFAAQVPI